MTQQLLTIFIIAVWLIIPRTLLNTSPVKFIWDANPETNIQTYKLHIGPSHNNYTQTITTGNVTQYTVAGMNQGQTYYVSLSAVNTDNQESQFSTDLVYTVPYANITITGNVSACGTASPEPNVTMTLSGSVFATTQTDSSGNYSFTLPQNSTYTITPTKQSLTPGNARINTVDVIATSQHFINSQFPVTCSAAGDVNGNGVTNTLDVTIIQRFVLSIPTTMQTGKFKFTQLSNPLDFKSILMGDVMASSQTLLPLRTREKRNKN